MGIEERITPDARDPRQLAEFKAGVFAKIRVRRGKGEDVPYTPHYGQMLMHFPESEWEYVHPVTNVKTIHEPEDPWIYWVNPSGRRSGKTISASADATFELGLPGTQTWIVAPNYELTDRVFEYVYDWVVRQQIYGAGSVVKSSKTKDQRYIEMAWGSFVKGKSADSPDSLVGEQLDLLIMDEAARMAEKIWLENLEPTLIDRKGRVIFTSTPRGVNWFAKYYNRGLHPDTQSRGWRCHRTRTVDNPFIDEEWLNQKRYETPEDVWAQEYEGDFSSMAGLIWPDFEAQMSPKGHLFDPKGMVFDSSYTYYRAVDVGSIHPTACVWGAVDKEGNVWVYREYEEQNVVHEIHAESIAALTAEKIALTYISPDAARRSLLKNNSPEDRLCALDLYRRAGVYARKASDNVSAGISEVARYLRATLEDRSTHPKLYISKNCQKLTAALQSYSRMELQTSREIDAPDRPRKFNDHLPDALRYLLAGKPMYRAYWEEEQEMYHEPQTRGSNFASVPMYD